MSNFWKRTTTGFLFVTAISAAILMHSLSFIILFGLLAILTLLEYYSLYGLDRLHKTSGLVAGGLIYMVTAWICLAQNERDPWVFFVPVFFLLVIAELFIHNKKENGQVFTQLFGMVYIILPFSLLVRISFLPGFYDFTFALALITTVWVNDTMAYVTGSVFGRHKLFERISPKKTWEGFAGGFIFCIIFGIVNNYLYQKTLLTHWVNLSIIVSIFATFGDLAESLIKRKLEIKDSGRFLPGHGGFLDRFDGMLFVIPFYYLYLVFMIF